MECTDGDEPMASQYPGVDEIPVVMDGIDVSLAIAELAAAMDFDGLRRLQLMREVTESFDRGELSPEDYNAYWVDFQDWRQDRIVIERIRNGND